ncbi:nuclear pore complex protein nup160 [Anaeramoeba ignava]|uniref:Nuclear pore complex protein nup160 n=1 Tax=Anaeramoeba ignava TaxID=1746090 RepID=A0A9Q0LKV8_ANAIG|nr:nuclear pore complex protein nup160 [Anaeramoeba ignava]
MNYCESQLFSFSKKQIPTINVINLNKKPQKHQNEKHFSFPFSGLIQLNFPLKNHILSWKVENNQLLLVHLALKHTLLNNEIMFKFDEQIIYKSISITQENQQIILFIATISGTIHRISFPFNELELNTKGNEFAQSFFHNYTLNNFQFDFSSLKNSSKISTLCCLNNLTIIIGGENGNLFIIEYSEEKDKIILGPISQIQYNSSIKRFLGGLVPNFGDSKNQPSKIIAMNPIIFTQKTNDININYSETDSLNNIQFLQFFFIATISQDSKLRIWSIQSKQCIHEESLIDSPSPNTAQFLQQNIQKYSESSIQMKIISNGTNNFDIFIHAAQGNEPEFRIYSFQFDKKNTTKLTFINKIPSLQFGNLISFEISDPPIQNEDFSKIDSQFTDSNNSQSSSQRILWGLWSDEFDSLENSLNINYSLKFHILNNSQKNPKFHAWKEVICLKNELPNSPTQKEAGDSIQSIFDYFKVIIFDQNYFSHQNLLLSFEEFLKEQSLSIPLNFQSFTKEDLKEFLDYTFQNILQDFNEKYPNFEDHQIVEFAFVFFLRLFDYCIKIWHNLNLSIALNYCPILDSVCICKNSSITILRPCLISEEISQIIEHNITPIYSDFFGNSMSRLLYGLSLIRQNIPKNFLDELQDVLFNLNDPLEYCFEKLSWVSTGLIKNPEERVEFTKFNNKMLKIWNKIPYPVTLLESFINMIDIYDGNNENGDQNNKPNLFNSPALPTSSNYSEIVYSIVAERFRQSVHSNYQICRDLLLFLFFVSQARSSLITNSIETMINIDELLNQDPEAKLGKQLIESPISFFIDNVILKCVKLLKIYFILDWCFNNHYKPSQTDKTQIQVSREEDEKKILKVYIRDFFTKHGKEQNKLMRSNFWVFVEETSKEPWDNMMLNHINLRNSELIHFLSRNKFFYSLAKLCETSKTIHNIIFDHSAFAFLGKAYIELGNYDQAFQCFIKEGFFLKKYYEMISAKRDDNNINNDLDALFHFYTNVMEQFDLVSQHKLTIKIGEIAISQFDANLEYIGNFWTRIFNQNIKLKDYYSAFNALFHIPNKTTQNDCLDLFILEVCRNGYAHILVNLPQVSILSKQIVQVLSQKAEELNLDQLFFSKEPEKQANFHYYNILFNFLTSQNQFRSAAESLLPLCLRIENMIPSAISIELLSKFKTEEIFLNVNQTKSTQISRKKFLTLLDEFEKSLILIITSLELLDESCSWICVEKSKRLKSIFDFQTTSQDQTNQQLSLPERIMINREEVEIFELKQIQNQYVFIHSLRKLFMRNSIIPPTSRFNVKNLVSQLLNYSMIETALTLLVQYNLPLDPVFQTLTTKCVLIQKDFPKISENHSKLLLQRDLISPMEIELEDSITLLETEISLKDKKTTYWKVLENYLAKYDSRNSCYNLHQIVIQTILEIDPHFGLPLWLLKSYQEKDPENLLKNLIHYNLLNEAFSVAFDMIYKIEFLLETPKIEAMPNMFNIPYLLFDNLIKISSQKIQKQIDQNDYNLSTIILQDNLRLFQSKMDSFFSIISHFSKFISKKY